MSCPTPDKPAFAYRHSAEAAMRSYSVGYGAPKNCYQCRCGKWHLTSKAVQW